MKKTLRHRDDTEGTEVKKRKGPKRLTRGCLFTSMSITARALPCPRAAECRA